MLRPARLFMMVLIAMFIVAVPTAVAQSPVADQYSTPIEGDGGAAAGAGKVDAASGGNAAPVQVRDVSAAQADKLPFTGAQISLIALIGLGLFAAGTLGVASTRRRAPASTS